ncbi:hypothetical protein AAH051_22200, partial [Phocaeicola dorei]
FCKFTLLEPYKQLYYNILIYRTPLKLVTHKDMTLMKDKFEVIGKLKIKENFNRSGGYDYLSNLERFEDILNDIDRHMEIFRNVKFPIKLLCEIN